MSRHKSIARARVIQRHAWLLSMQVAAYGWTATTALSCDGLAMSLQPVGIGLVVS